jgi:hypothetical protein
VSPFSGEWTEKSALLGPLERANLNHWTWLFTKEPPTHHLETGKRCIFRNVVFCSYLEFRTVDKGHQSDSSVVHIYTFNFNSILIKTKFRL